MVFNATFYNISAISWRSFHRVNPIHNIQSRVNSLSPLRLFPYIIHIKPFISKNFSRSYFLFNFLNFLFFKSRVIIIFSNSLILMGLVLVLRIYGLVYDVYRPF